jgi:death-on-curing protein
MLETDKIIYFDLSYVIKIHSQVINISGGLAGYDLNKVLTIESILVHIQNDLYYPTLLDKVTHLLYSVNKNHIFFDGNKRLSLALSAYRLEINGYGYCVTDFVCKMENVVVEVADNKIDKIALKSIIQNIVF